MYCDKLVGNDLGRILATDPLEALDDPLHTLFQIQGTEVHSRNITLRGDSTDHLDCECYTIILDLLVIVLWAVVVHHLCWAGKRRGLN